MVGQIHHGGRIGLGRNFQPQHIVLRERINCLDIQRAGIAGIAVRAVEDEPHATLKLLCIPDAIGVALLARASVQVVGTVVYGQRILLAAQRKLACGDAVGIAAGNLAGAGAVHHPVFGLGIGKGHVVYHSGLVGHLYGNDAGAKVAEHNPAAGSVRNCKMLYLSLRTFHLFAPSEIATLITRGSRLNCFL